jgi:hypothetical protein
VAFGTEERSADKEPRAHSCVLRGIIYAALILGLRELHLGNAGVVPWSDEQAEMHA